METGLLRVILSKIEEFYPAAADSNSNELVENYFYYLLHSVGIYFNDSLTLDFFNFVLLICIELHTQKKFKIEIHNLYSY